MSNRDSTPIPTRAICEQARLTRDARFDGLFFTAVRTTGIYCRPVCPAPAPRERNVDYFPSAAAAAAAGFRPCLRCRPEAAPASPLHRTGSELVAGALRLIEQGELGGALLAGLADKVGVSERHLRRLFVEELGASPQQVAATRRLLFAKQLLTETSLPITDIALAAGYASVRRFNATFRDAYGKPPRDIRRAREAPPEDGIVLRLPYRPPYDLANLIGFLARRAIPGVESVDDGVYRRSIRVDGKPAAFSVAEWPDANALALRLYAIPTRHIMTITANVRRVFDVDADPAAIAAHLKASPLLAPLIRRWPGQRLPGAWDGFELAVRAVLGQQISVAAARTLAHRMLERHGVAWEKSGMRGIHALFPQPADLVDAPLESLGIMRVRAATIRSLAAACLDGRVDFGRQQPLDAFVAQLCELPGIGDWTAHYIAMRALSQPDAFPAGDLVLRRQAGGGTAISERELRARAEAWRPWRAYAVMLLWRSAS